MSTSQELVQIIKAELKATGLTYAQLAQRLTMAESSVKRMLSKGDMSLSRIDEICRALKLDFSELARRVAEKQPLRKELTLAQERAVVADRKLLLMAICCLSQWTFEQILNSYQFTEVECIRYLTKLDKLGIIELRPLNRYRLKVAKTFKWQPDGPVMQFFRQNVVGEYFSGGFENEDELLMLVHGSISPAMASALAERLQRVAEDFAQQHLADQRLPRHQCKPYTLLLGMRSWWFQAFVDLWREDGPLPSPPHGARDARKPTSPRGSVSRQPGRR